MFFVDMGLLTARCIYSRSFKMVLISRNKHMWICLKQFPDPTMTTQEYTHTHDYILFEHPSTLWSPSGRQLCNPHHLMGSQQSTSWCCWCWPLLVSVRRHAVMQPITMEHSYECWKLSDGSVEVRKTPEGSGSRWTCGGRRWGNGGTWWGRWLWP